MKRVSFQPTSFGEKQKVSVKHALIPVKGRYSPVRLETVQVLSIYSPVILSAHGIFIAYAHADFGQGWGTDMGFGVFPNKQQKANGYPLALLAGRKRLRTLFPALIHSIVLSL